MEKCEKVAWRQRREKAASARPILIKEVILFSQHDEEIQSEEISRRSELVFRWIFW